MAFIGTVPVQSADPEVRAMYEAQQRTMGYVPNYSKVFSHKPGVNAGWASLLSSIRAHMEPRRYEMVTLAAALALGSSYCSLAHGKILRDRFYPPVQLETIVAGAVSAVLDATDTAIMAFAAQVARNATAVTAQDVQSLRNYGLTDAEIFDVAAAASARCFFSKLLDALGAEPDAPYAELEEGLRLRLTVGRPISAAAPERLSG